MEPVENGTGEQAEVIDYDNQFFLHILIQEFISERVCEVDKDSEEEVPAKHPALITQKQINPVTK